MDNYKLNKNKYTPFRGQESLKMGTIGCSETSVRIYHYSLRNNTEQRNSHLLRGGILKSQQPRLLFSRGNFLYKMSL
jgi:hypothetical protein